MKKISIIVPVYKVEKYLPKCIESILAQTYTNFELILVDDGSPDNCGAICDEYAKKDSRIKVIHKENGGLSDARNKGIDVSNGEFIVFVDSDDYIAPQMLESMYNRIIEDGSDMVLCNFSYVDENGNSTEKSNFDSPIKNETISKKEAFSKLCKKKNWYYIVAWNKLYKKDIFNQIRFPKGKIHEDEFVIHHIISMCQKISCVEKSLYYYLQREGSIMNSTHIIKRLDAVDALIDRVSFFFCNNMFAEVEQTFKYIMNMLLKVYKKADLSIFENQEKYQVEMRKVKSIYKEKIFLTVCLKTKICFLLFCINPSMYNFLRKLRVKFSKLKNMFNRHI